MSPGRVISVHVGTGNDVVVVVITAAAVTVIGVVTFSITDAVIGATATIVVGMSLGRNRYWASKQRVKLLM